MAWNWVRGKASVVVVPHVAICSCRSQWSLAYCGLQRSSASEVSRLASCPCRAWWLLAHCGLSLSSLHGLTPKPTVHVENLFGVCAGIISDMNVRTMPYSVLASVAPSTDMTVRSPMTFLIAPTVQVPFTQASYTTLSQHALGLKGLAGTSNQLLENMGLWHSIDFIPTRPYPSFVGPIPYSFFPPSVWGGFVDRLP